MPERRVAVVGAGLERSRSGLVFFWGMERVSPGLGVNNVFFSGDYPAGGMLLGVLSGKIAAGLIRRGDRT